MNLMLPAGWGRSNHGESRIPTTFRGAEVGWAPSCGSRRCRGPEPRTRRIGRGQPVLRSSNARPFSAGDDQPEESLDEARLSDAADRGRRSHSGLAERAAVGASPRTLRPMAEVAPIPPSHPPNAGKTLEDIGLIRLQRGDDQDRDRVCSVGATVADTIGRREQAWPLPQGICASRPWPFGPRSPTSLFSSLPSG